MMGRGQGANRLHADDIIILLASELGRERELHESESLFLQQAIARQRRRTGEPSRRAWSREEDAELARLWGEGMTDAQIAGRLPRRTLSAVRRRIETRRGVDPGAFPRRKATAHANNTHGEDQ